MDSYQRKKFDKFVKEPMRNKPIAELPGIYACLEYHLESICISEIGDMLGYYLKYHRDEELFYEWFHDNLCLLRGSMFDTSKKIAHALEVWCTTNLQYGIMQDQLHEIPGIDDTTAHVLGHKLNITTPSDLLGHYLILKRDNDDFQYLIKRKVSSISPKSLPLITEALDDWCNTNL